MQRFKIGQAVTVHHLKPWKPGPPIQMRGRVAGYDGDRLILHREFRAPGHRRHRYDSLNALQRSGDYGIIELHRGSWISRRRYYRKNGTWIGDLYNIQTPTEFRSGLVRYVDVEIDVSCRPGPPLQVAIHDAADLDRAVDRGHIPAELGVVARRLAEGLTQLLAHTPDRDHDSLDSLEWDLTPFPDTPAEVEDALRQIQEERLPDVPTTRPSKPARPRARRGATAHPNQTA